MYKLTSAQITNKNPRGGCKAVKEETDMPDETNEPQDTPEVQTPDASGNATPAPSGESNQVVLSKAALSERVEKAKRSAVSEILRSTGFESVDLLKAALSELAQVRSERETADQKAAREVSERETAIKALQERTDAAERQASALKLTLRQRDTDAAIRTAAAKKAKSPDDVVMWAQSSYGLAHYQAILTDEADAVDSKKIEALIAECEKAKPEWFKADAPGTPSNSGARPMPTGTRKEEVIREVLANRRY